MANEAYKILLVDDEKDILEFISYNLKKEGFLVETATNGRQAIEKAKVWIPHLIVLDVMMPEMDGIETCEEIRKYPGLDSSLVAFLTARGEDYSQIAGFNAGADDYITKPIRPKVLVSRVRALLKRHSHEKNEADEQQEDVLISGKLKIDRSRYQVTHGEEVIYLPKKEFELLNLLVSRSERVISREEIYTSIWGDDVIVGDRTIDVHIRKLREKIGENLIQTIKGVGYKFVGDQNQKDPNS